MTVQLLFFIKPQFRIYVKISTTLINARLDTSDYGRSHSFQGPGAVANGFTSIKNALIAYLFIFHLN